MTSSIPLVMYILNRRPFSQPNNLTRNFVASGRAFNFLTRAFNLLTRNFNLAALAFSLLTRQFEIVTRGFELVNCEFELVTRNSCFTFPRWTQPLQAQIIKLLIEKETANSRL